MSAFHDAGPALASGPPLLTVSTPAERERFHGVDLFRLVYPEPRHQAQVSTGGTSISAEEHQQRTYGIEPTRAFLTDLRRRLGVSISFDLHGNLTINPSLGLLSERELDEVQKRRPAIEVLARSGLKPL